MRVSVIPAEPSLACPPTAGSAGLAPKAGDTPKPALGASSPGRMADVILRAQIENENTHRNAFALTGFRASEVGEYRPDTISRVYATVERIRGLISTLANDGVAFEQTSLKVTAARDGLLARERQIGIKLTLTGTRPGAT